MKGDVHRRMLVWFVANPDEALTFGDIALKLNCSEEAARNAAKTMAREQTTRVTEDPSFLRPGGSRRMLVSIGPVLRAAIDAGRS